VPRIEYAVDEWDLRGREPTLDAGELPRHVQTFGDEGWELVTIAFNLELRGVERGHLSIFRRTTDD
jgi:hypothetical protein